MREALPRFLLQPLLFSALALTAVSAAALDFRSVSEPAVLYDAPAAKAAKQFVIARATPVELVLTNGSWSKVRESSGKMAWMESRLLASKRTVQVKAERAQVRAQADDKAPLVFEAEKDVVLDLVDVGTSGWAKVRHRDGATGYVRAAQVWGL